MNGSGARRWLAVVALALALLAAGLDITVLNLALPTLAIKLDASTSGLQWIVDAYSLVLAVTLLPAGLMGDRLGRKKVLLFALAVFGAASLWCAYSGSAGMLIAARSVLGLGAACLIPLSLSVLPVMFSEEERQRALTVLLGAIFLGFPLGPILGGWLLDNFWWGSVFLINVPMSVLAFVAVAALLPESRSAERPRLDLGGVVLSSAGLAGLTYGAIEAGEKGWGDVRTLVPLVAGAVVLSAFVIWERRFGRTGQPLVDLALFRSAGFAWGTILATLTTFAMFGVLFTVPQFFQSVQGTDAIGAGVRLLPLIGGLVIGSAAADRLAARTGAKAMSALGFAFLAGGLAMGAFTRADGGTWFVVAWVVVVGVGLGLALPTNMNAAIGALSPESSGVGSALIQAARQVGGTLGVAVLGTVVNSAYRDRLDLAGLTAQAASAVRDGVSSGVAVARQLDSAALLDSVRFAFAHAMDVMLWTCGGIAVLGVVLALVFLPGRAAAQAASGLVLAARGRRDAVLTGVALEYLARRVEDGGEAAPTLVHAASALLPDSEGTEEERARLAARTVLRPLALRTLMWGVGAASQSTPGRTA